MNDALENRSKEELIALINSQDLKVNSLEQSKSQLEQSKSQLEQSKSELEQKVSKLEFQLKELRRLIFGTKRERFMAAENPFQQKLPFEEFLKETQKEAEPATEEIKYKRKKKSDHQGRLALPDHLEVKETIIEPEVDTTGMVCIGKEITDRLEYQPGNLFIDRIVRLKYALPKKEQDKLVGLGEEKSPIVIADLPLFPIEKCMAGTGLLTQIFIDKFIDHLPYYRQIERYKREGVHIKSSTIDGWQRQLSNLLEPLYNRMVSKVVSQGYIQADEMRNEFMNSIKVNTM